MAFHLDKFIPKNVVTAMVIKDLREKLVFSNLIRYATTAELGRGESYDFPSVGDVNVGDYNGSAITIQNPTDSGVTLTVDQAKYIALLMDKVDNKQAAYDVLDLYVNKATFALANTADKKIASDIYTNAGLSVTGGAVDSSNVADLIRDIKVEMDNANIPSEGRWLAVPAELAGDIALSEINVASTTNESARKNGFVQNFMGFDIYQSNNIPTGSGTKGVIAGVPDGYAHVDSLSDMSMGEHPDYFGTLIKALHVYGGKTLNPNMFVSTDIDV